MSLFTPLMPALQEAGLDFQSLYRSMNTETALLKAAAAEVAERSDHDHADVLRQFYDAREPVLHLLNAPAGWRDLTAMFGGASAADWPTIH